MERPTQPTRQGRLIAACFCGDLDGVRTLLGDGKIKILRGDTTPEEVARFAQAESPVASEFVDA